MCIRDSICPDTMEFEKDYFKVGERYGRVLYLKDYASYISDEMVSEFADINQKDVYKRQAMSCPHRSKMKWRQTAGSFSNIWTYRPGLTAIPPIMPF